MRRAPRAGLRRCRADQRGRRGGDRPPGARGRRGGRLVAAIGRKVRSELDLEDVLRVAVEETGKASGVSRAFIRLGEPGEPMPIRAEWDDEGFVPIGTSSERLAVSNLAARERRTSASGDVRTDPELEDAALGGIRT